MQSILQGGKNCDWSIIKHDAPPRFPALTYFLSTYAHVHTCTHMHTHAHSYPTYTLQIESPETGAYIGFPKDGGRAHSEHGETQTTGAEGRGTCTYCTCIFPVTFLL